LLALKDYRRLLRMPIWAQPNIKCIQCCSFGRHWRTCQNPSSEKTSRSFSTTNALSH
jgi:hypothetical protein